LGQPNWSAFYKEEAKYKRFLPGEDPAELNRIGLVNQLLRGVKFRSSLDVGCGDGYQCWLLASRNSTVVGLDLALERLFRAKAYFTSGSFVQGRAYDLPFPDNSFDLVMAVEILEHLEEPERAVREFRRVSRQFVLITVPLKERITKVVCPYCLRSFPQHGHIQSFDEERVRSLLLQQSMIVLKVKDFKPAVDNYVLLRAVRPLLKMVFPKQFERGLYLGVLCKKA